MDKKIHEAASLIWNYHVLNHAITQSDCILALGSNDIRVAKRAAELYHQKIAPKIIFSGGVGELTAGLWDCSEARHFAQIAMQLGVLEEDIFLEENSTNTGENIQFTQVLLNEIGMQPQRFVVVQKPFMERRTFATFKKQWPNQEFFVTSPQIAFNDYPNSFLSTEDIIHVMVGDLQRIKVYPTKGFQVYQEIPDEVWSAFELLVDEGYTGHLIK
ncbi:MAG: YdcF family protein [Lentisphaeria bacterium]|nr:YdcF family protein [Lentisphaeria bacterium]